MELRHKFDIDDTTVDVIIYGNATNGGITWCADGVWQIDRGTCDLDDVVREDTGESVLHALTDKQVAEAMEVLALHAT